MQTVAAIPNTHVVALFDGTRVVCNTDHSKDTADIEAAFTESDRTLYAEIGLKSLIMTHASAASHKVELKPSVFGHYFRFLFSQKDSQDMLSFSANLKYFQGPNGECQSSVETDKQLKVWWKK